MLPVRHLAWLGTEMGFLDLTYAEEEEIEEYLEMIAEYRVECNLCIFQYSSLVNAIAQVVEESKVQLLFATLPNSFVPGWRNFQIRRLRGSLAKHHCELIETPHIEMPQADVGEEIPGEWQGEEEDTPEEMPLVFNPFDIKEKV